MAKTKDIPNNLESYLDELNRKYPDSDFEHLITSRTDIDSTELSKLKRGYITRFAAEKFYKIHLAIERPIEEIANKVYPDLRLPEKPHKDFKRNKSDLGNILLGKFSQEEIEYKTDIKHLRLKSILKDNEIIILASELILIELATERKKGSLFKQLFKKIKVGPKKK